MLTTTSAKARNKICTVQKDNPLSVTWLQELGEEIFEKKTIFMFLHTKTPYSIIKKNTEK